MMLVCSIYLKTFLSNWTSGRSDWPEGEKKEESFFGLIRFPVKDTFGRENDWWKVEMGAKWSVVRIFMVEKERKTPEGVSNWKVSTIDVDLLIEI